MVLQRYVSGNFPDARGGESEIVAVLALRVECSALLGVSIYASRARATLRVEVVDETLEPTRVHLREREFLLLK
jgi:hypothetical protein